MNCFCIHYALEGGFAATVSNHRGVRPIVRWLRLSTVTTFMSSSGRTMDGNPS